MDPNPRTSWMRHLGRLAGIGLLVLVAGCQPALDEWSAPVSATPTPAAAAQPQLGDITQCALTFLLPAVQAGTVALKAAPEVFLARATKVLDEALRTKDFVAAVLTVYGRPSIRDLSSDEANEVLLIISGLDSCGKVSDPLRQSAVGIIDILRSLVQPGYTGSAEPQDVRAWLGDWQGTYVCSQGETGVRLSIAADGATPSATFSFSAIPSNPGVPSGSFTMKGSVSGSGLQLSPDQWTSRPDGYEMVDLLLGAPTDGGATLRGTVTTSGCSTIALTRP